MDQGWDHTENEDKLLLAHTLGMNMDMGTVMDLNMRIDSVSMIGCNNNTSNDLNIVMDTRLDYNKHLSDISINNINVLCFRIVNSLNFDFDEICSYILSAYIKLCKICNICYSCKCKCTCSCKTPCTESTICLCLCSCTSSPSGSSNGCCVCICKHKDDCKCVCICLCNKKGDQCCCNTGTSHECKECLLKVDIQSLLNKTSRILWHLRWIKCCLCNDVKINYSSIISRIHSIESLFNQISTEILKLAKIYKTLSLMTVISTKCEKCNCKDKIKYLIKHIERALHYYTLFGSRIDDIRSFVEYKLFYPKSKQILENLERSVKSLSNQIQLINSKIFINSDYTEKLNNVVMSVYSDYWIIECYPKLYILFQSSKISTMVYNIKWLDMCVCVTRFKSNAYPFKTSDFYKFISVSYKNNIDELKKLFIVNDGNHSCICLVIKYVLYPNLIKLFYYLRQVYLDTLGKQTREFTSTMFNGIRINDMTKLIYLIILLLDKITLWIKNKYDYGWLVYTTGVYIQCFCYDVNKSYYEYLISIILYLSSVMENIWTMQIETIRIAIEFLSTLYSQLEIYDLNSVNDTKKRSCNSIYTLLVNKQCQEKGTCKCKEGGKKCCCWCVTCFNLLIMCIYLSIQCNLCKAICNNKEKTNGCKIEDWNKFCKIEKLECECKCQEKNGLCCILQLALCSQLQINKGNGCKELSELLKCCDTCAKSNGCCKTLLDKVKKGLCKLLLLGCCCNDDKCGCPEGDVKTCCLLFGNECHSVAVVVFCKCGEATKCCCLYTLVEKFKEKLSEIFKKVCKGDCCCKDLQKSCQELCCPTGCEGESGCPCKTLKAEIEKICNGTDGNCLCKLIDECIKKLCTKKNCECKNKEGCCKCQCCKLVGMSIKILVRACRANVLDPYKRIVLELLGCSKNKPELIRKITKFINARTLNNIYLVKNSYSSYPYRIGGYPGTSNRVTNVETRNWGYDTKYEHDVSTDMGFTYNYPDISNNTDSYASSRSSNKAFKMILSRLMVGGVIVFLFLYLRVSYQQFLVESRDNSQSYVEGQDTHVETDMTTPIDSGNGHVSNHIDVVDMFLNTNNYLTSTQITSNTTTGSSIKIKVENIVRNRKMYILIVVYTVMCCLYINVIVRDLAMLKLENEVWSYLMAFFEIDSSLSFSNCRDDLQ